VDRRKYLGWSEYFQESEPVPNATADRPLDVGFRGGVPGRSRFDTQEDFLRRSERVGKSSRSNGHFRNRTVLQVALILDRALGWQGTAIYSVIAAMQRPLYAVHRRPSMLPQARRITRISALDYSLIAHRRRILKPFGCFLFCMILMRLASQLSCNQRPCPWPN